MAKHKKKEYKVTVVEHTDITDEELLQRYEQYKELVYKLLFSSEYRKPTEDNV